VESKPRVIPINNIPQHRRLINAGLWILFNLVAKAITASDLVVFDIIKS
jgi:hypothetical protein